MTVGSRSSSEEGFTIQELLVAIVAGSLLVGFSFSLYIFVASVVQKDLRTREHRQNTLRALELIASDIEQASSLVHDGESILELQSLEHGKVLYTWTEGEFYRGSMRFGPPQAERWSLLLASPSAGRITFRLKSRWEKDSAEISTEVSLPVSSAVIFHGP